jgi:hypothetical protein
MASIEQYFQRPEFTIQRRLLLMVIGPVKTGKTTLALTASELGPLALLDYDMGLEGVISNFKGRDLWQLPLDAPKSMSVDVETSLEDYKRAWQKAKDAYAVAIADPKIKTVVVDSASEMWEACRLSHLGKLDKVPPFKYGECNADFRKLLRDANDRADLSAILIHKTKDEYLNDQKTGRKVYAGFGDVPGWAQMVVEMWKRGKDYGLTIVECRHKRALEGTELPAAVANFPMLLQLVHGAEE